MATVERARQLDEPIVAARVLEALYEAHAPGLRRHCRRLTHDPHAAEDLLQETFVRFMARFPDPPADMNVAGYLHATARNILWKQLRDEHEVADGDIERSAGPDDDLEVDPERALLLGEQQGLVRRCSAALTGRQRRALVLREVEGHSYAEIGSDLGIGTDAVAQVISRARVRLRVAVRRAHVDLDQLSPECRARLGPLSEYLDGHATKSSPELEAHLAECESCRRTLAAFQAAGSRLRGALPFAPIAGVLARIGEAVRLGGGAPVDAVRAGSVVVAAALAIGGGGIYVAHETSAAPAARATSTSSHATVPASRAGSAKAAATPDGSERARDLGAPGVARGRRVSTGGASPHVRHPGAAPKRTSSPSAVPKPTSTAPVSTPDETPRSTPTAHPATTPAAAPSEPPAATTPPATTPKPPSNGTGPAGVTTPSDVVGATTRTADRVVAPVVTTVAKTVVEPVVSKVVAPVTAPVTKAVAPITAPVVKAVAPVTEPVTKAVAPVTDPVVKAVAPVTDPIVKALAPALPPATTPAAPPPPAQTTPAPAVTTPAVTTPAITTPVITVPSITLPKLGG
jgi:RNA polymerase sigma factor (sigma-70 family)